MYKYSGTQYRTLHTTLYVVHTPLLYTTHYNICSTHTIYILLHTCGPGGRPRGGPGGVAPEYD